MIDRLLALLAFVTLAAFLGILLFHVPRIDLGVVLLVTLVLTGH